MPQTPTTVFTKTLLHWHSQHNHRQMPWKGELDPYKIWLSEIILQQTRVAQGWAYYQKFIAHYPSICHLALAKDDDVFKLWEGLGYYSRCRNLLATARLVAEQYQGIFPTTYSAILLLKGIGPYTAAAIASFAYNLPHAVVDGNVYRVLARYFGVATPTDSLAGKKLFTNLAHQCLHKKKPALYNQAIMDFGATVCTPANPICTTCLLQSNCVAYQQSKVLAYPIKQKILKKRSRWFTFFVVAQGNQYLVKKRVAKDIWQGLHQFYLIENTEACNWDMGKALAECQGIFGAMPTIQNISVWGKQQLTHQTVYSCFIQVSLAAAGALPVGYFYVSKKELALLAFPKTITQFLQNNLFKQ